MTADTTLQWTIERMTSRLRVDGKKKRGPPPLNEPPVLSFSDAKSVPQIDTQSALTWR